MDAPRLRTSVMNTPVATALFITAFITRGMALILLGFFIKKYGWKWSANRSRQQQLRYVCVVNMTVCLVLNTLVHILLMCQDAIFDHHYLVFIILVRFLVWIVFITLSLALLYSVLADIHRYRRIVSIKKQLEWPWFKYAYYALYGCTIATILCYTVRAILAGMYQVCTGGSTRECTWIESPAKIMTIFNNVMSGAYFCYIASLQFLINFTMAYHVFQNFKPESASSTSSLQPFNVPVAAWDLNSKARQKIKVLLLLMCLAGFFTVGGLGFSLSNIGQDYVQPIESMAFSFIPFSAFFTFNLTDTLLRYTQDHRSSVVELRPPIPEPKSSSVEKVETQDMFSRADETSLYFKGPYTFSVV